MSSLHIICTYRRWHIKSIPLPVPMQTPSTTLYLTSYYTSFYALCTYTNRCPICDWQALKACPLFSGLRMRCLRGQRDWGGFFSAQNLLLIPHLPPNKIQRLRSPACVRYTFPHALAPAIGSRLTRPPSVSPAIKHILPQGLCMFCPHGLECSSSDGLLPQAT